MAQREHYEVIAGTVGVVYRGTDRAKAERVYRKYAEKARAEASRDPRRRRPSVRIRRSRRDASDHEWHVLDTRTGCICPVGSERAAIARAQQGNRTAGEERLVVQQSGCTAGRAPEDVPIVYEAGDPARRSSRSRRRDPQRELYAVLGHGVEADWGPVIQEHGRTDEITVRWLVGHLTDTVDRKKVALYRTRAEAEKAYQRRTKSRRDARRARRRDPSKARKYYVVDQAQRGLWQQVGRFYSREDAERFRGSLGGRTRIVHTYPSSFSAPAERDRRMSAARRRRARRDPARRHRFPTRYIVTFAIPKANIEEDLTVVAHSEREARQQAIAELQYTKGARILRIADTEESPWVE